ncbi:MAG: hypothetical protein IT304_02365 [Dehalococcoidia bacterium]|nr:hypothetical protein [Dehalococcoidia bacterium]
MSTRPQTAASRPSRLRRLLSASVLLPLAGLFAVAAAVLGVLLALGVNGEAEGVTFTSCKVGEEGCQLRSPIHVHADFALVVRGQKYNFDQSKYIAEEGGIESPYAHVHRPRTNIVHVHYSNTTWDDFFSAIKFKLTDPTLPGVTPQNTCLQLDDGNKYCASAGETFKFFVNGVQVDGIAFTTINDLDRVLISFGPEAAEQVTTDQLPQLTDEACILSERCKARAPADPEPCSASSQSCTKPGG